MTAVLGRVVEWVSDDFPGWVKVEVTDAEGRVLTFVDKVPIFGVERMDATTSLPEDVWLSCERLPKADNRIRVSLRHGVETADGVREF